MGKYIGARDRAKPINTYFEEDQKKFKMKLTIVCLVAALAFLALVSVSEAGVRRGEDDKPCECGVIYCDHMCKGGKRELEESPQAAKRGEGIGIFNSCHGCDCRCCHALDPDCINADGLYFIITGVRIEFLVRNKLNHKTKCCN